MENQLKIEDSLPSSMYRIPLFSFNPNSFPYIFTYEQPTVSVDENGFISIEPSGDGRSMGAASCIKIRTKGKLPTHLEKSVNEVNYIVTRGCFCRSKNCFYGLDPENIYRHRQIMSKLADADHNIFLMGVVMTCLSNSKGVAQKTYMKYTYKGKRVCKGAFLYLHYCTHQQLQDVRGHLIMYDVSPMPYVNRDSVKSRLSCKEELKPMKDFFSKYVEQHVGKENIDAYQNIFLPLGTTKKSVHQAYMSYMQKYRPGRKCMSYYTFINILSDHFPHIIFYRFGRQVALSKTRLEDTIVQAVPHQNQTLLFENQSNLKLSEISKDSDPVGSFSSDKLVICEV